MKVIHIVWKILVEEVLHYKRFNKNVRLMINYFELTYNSMPAYKLQKLGPNMAENSILYFKMGLNLLVDITM